MKVLALIGLLFSSGCGQNGVEELLADYLSRVNNSTGTPVVESGSYSTRLLTYPRHRDLYLEERDLRIGLLDLVALGECGLAELIGARNSSLGKVMAPSQQLLYEHRFLVSARACADTLRASADADSALTNLLAEIIQAKERNISQVFWNATFADPAFAALFSLASGALPLEGDGGAIAEALSYFVHLQPRLGNSALNLTSEELEAHYYVLEHQRYGGQLLHAMEVLTHHLDGASAAIETRLAQETLCFNGRPTPDARVMHTVFTKFYVGRIQPYISRVHRQSKTLLTLTEELAQGRELPAAFSAYRDAQLRQDNPEGTWLRFEGSIRRHARTWQQLFDRCGLSATATTSTR